MKEYVIASIIIFVVYSIVGVFTDLFFVRSRFIRRTCILLYYGCILNLTFCVFYTIYKIILWKI